MINLLLAAVIQLTPDLRLETTEIDGPYRGPEFALPVGRVREFDFLHRYKWDSCRAKVLVEKYREGPYPDYDVAKPTPVIKINQVGYLPWAKKYAYLGWWRSDRGPVKFDVEGVEFSVYRYGSADGEGNRSVVMAGPIVHRMDDPVTKDGTPWTGEIVYEMDISALRAEGEYYIEIPGIGRSDVIRVSENAAAKSFNVHLAGLRSQRCGEKCHRTVFRGREFSPDPGAYKQNGQFAAIKAELPSLDEKLSLPGGWHDAADYDRRPQHLAIVRELALVYLGSDPMGEAHGVRPRGEAHGVRPQILDEAEWGLRHLIRAQQADGGVGTWIETVKHPVWGEVKLGAENDELPYVLSKATPRSTADYALAAEILAAALEKGGRREDAARYRDSAARAREYVKREAGPEPAKSGKGIKPPDALQEPLIATWKFLDPAELKVAKRKVMNISKDILVQLESSYPYRLPWWPPANGKSKNMSWGQGLPLSRARFLVAAHILTGDRRYLDAAALCVDFHNGANPASETLTTGLGIRYPKSYLTLDGYHAGITPYHFTSQMPKRCYEAAWGGDKAKGDAWPILRRYPNVEDLTVAASEYTVWETIAPAVTVTGYLSIARP